MLDGEASDAVQLELWLGTKTGLSSATVESYSRAGRRLLQWCQETHRRFDSLTVSAVEVYWDVLKNPPKHWIADRSVPLAERPATQVLYGPISGQSLAQEQTLLTTLFSGLVDTGYLQSNPFKSAPRQEVPKEPPTAKALSPAAWEALRSWADALPPTPVNSRYTWVIRLFYYAGLRRAEAQASFMSDFFNSGDQWYLRVIGPRSKIRDVTVSPSLYQALCAYRKANGLPVPPSRDEKETPLILPLTGENRLLSTRRLNSLIEEIALRAGAAIMNPKVREELLMLTPQRFRHTSATHRLAKGAALTTVQDEMGHGTARTTRLYAQSSPEERIRDINLLD